MLDRLVWLAFDLFFLLMLVGASSRGSDRPITTRLFGG
jgi:hypothetical protein